MTQFFRVQRVFFKSKRTVYQPQYLVLSNKNVHFINVSDFSYDFSFGLAEVKEILLDKEDLGLCCIFRFYVKESLYYHAGNKPTLDNLVKTLEEARTETKTLGIPNLITRSVLLKDVKEESGMFAPVSRERSFLRKSSFFNKKKKKYQ